MQYAVKAPAIGVAEDGELVLLSRPDDPLTVVVERIEAARKAGHMPSEADLELIDDIPVLHQKDCEASALVIEFRF